MIYLDNAATSFPKPRAVLAELDRCVKKFGGNPGRGGHRLSRDASFKVFEGREALAELFSSDGPENVVFTYNDTYAINMALKGILMPGDHVIISNMEHNSVFRPVAALAKNGIISYSIFDAAPYCGEKRTENILHGIRDLITPKTKVLICTHVSNICSLTLPIEEIGKLCREKNIVFIVDCAQSAGHLPINMKKMNIDILCAPGHKGLYGIQGSGFMILRDAICLDPIIEGGSGVNSLLPEMPKDSPERFEAGTLSVPCISSLCAGIKYISECGIEKIHEQECLLHRRLGEMLSTLPKVISYCANKHGSVFLFNVGSIPSERVAEALDSKGICVRSGFHCAPLAHNALNTGENGAVRVSFGAFNKMRDIEVLYSAVRDIVYNGI